MPTIATNLDVIPRPTELRFDSGSSPLGASAKVSAPDDFSFEANQLRLVLKDAGISVEDSADLSIEFVLDAEDEHGLGDEGYLIDIDETGITVTAANSAGAFYAVQTIRQMLPAVPQVGQLTLPQVHILDRPRFSWRGFMFDVSRHFYSVAEIKGILDILAFHKMNVFHWHLVDDGGWRIEINRYPLLTERGAWRLKKPFMWDYLDIDFPEPGSGEEVYGGFYTHEQIREVVAYAAERHITVVPEIEMPGHSLAALWSYPELGCTEESAAIFSKEIGMQRPNVFCAGKEETFEFLSGVLEEVMELFPSEHIHVGGDEVFKILFENCANCQQRMKDEGLTTVDELQSYFIRRMEKFINAKGRILVGWDEILQGGLAPNAVVMSWRGNQGGLDAARAGHDVIMSPYSHCYFDFGYDRSPTSHVLEFQPVPDEMTPEEAEHVLGGQANLWTEYVPDIETVHRMMLPRLASMAEVLWAGKPELGDFNERLDSYKKRLTAMSIEWMEDETNTVPQHNVTN